MHKLLLKQRRINKGMTQKRLASILGKPQSFVSKYESGERRLDVEEFIQVCRALGESPAKLIDMIEQDKTHDH